MGLLSTHFLEWKNQDSILSVICVWIYSIHEKIFKKICQHLLGRIDQKHCFF